MDSVIGGPEYPLPLEDYKRYGRQMILDGFGLQGQVNLSRASVAVVGAGGLGCPALQYLGAAGVGRIGIFDHDRVEISNLQRQILHNEETVGIVNSRLVIDAVTSAISASNALTLLAGYDLILDCTDNVPTRYLLSDTAVALKTPLVSGAAQKFDGQLCVYHYGENGPCYRCIFPVPPKPSNVGSCEELGILGAVTGIIGNMQALEAIKILTGLHDGKPVMHIYNALSTPPFRTIKLRSKREGCPACGTGALEKALVRDTDYVQFCGGLRPDWEHTGLAQGEAGKRIDAKSLSALLASDPFAVEIIDVRQPTEFGIVHLPGSKNVPLKQLVEYPQNMSRKSRSSSPAGWVTTHRRQQTRCEVSTEVRV
ncbi:hypothetical protein D9611_001680 [Ephemerocybe angulata]|uniref:Rhodanese domain-containing protein n=1 Tax=Ephemerocybe angulata TaxID=980116 RepID=A0A8H5FMH3_9AGAR|nr:hypothetical protein D9611_001680 [Tulosesus angulatus]